MRLSLTILPAVRRLLLGLAVLPLAAACSSNGGGGQDAVQNAEALNERKINEAAITDKQEADANFLVRAASNALLEVELGKLAQARATAPVVRAFGAAVVRSRLDLLAALRTLAVAKQLAVPSALGDDEQTAYHEASTQTGAQLDKRVMALLVKIQKQDEDAFDDMKDDAYDGDIRGLAAKYYPPIDEQLDAAKEAAEAAEKLP
jgi:putative membrane protein